MTVARSIPDLPEPATALLMVLNAGSSSLKLRILGPDDERKNWSHGGPERRGAGCRPAQRSTLRRLEADTVPLGSHQRPQLSTALTVASFRLFAHDGGARVSGQGPGPRLAPRVRRPGAGDTVGRVVTGLATLAPVSHLDQHNPSVVSLTLEVRNGYRLA
jgi:hypothetical protein